MLLGSNCDCTLKTRSGSTALHLAAGSGNHDLCDLMMSLRDSDAFVEDDSGIYLK